MIQGAENIAEMAQEVWRQLALFQRELAPALGVSFAIVNRWDIAC